ncbi:MAG: adventurous gliding motility protein GltG [Deltaproteobacteria bacterium]
MPTPVTLKIFKGDALIATREFNRDIIKIGRLSSAHLCLEDDKVSRIHSVIEVASDTSISIIDMGSAEGTFVNGKRVNKGNLASGDEIRLGQTRLVLSVGGQPPVAPSPTPPATSEAPTLEIAPDLAAEIHAAAAAPPAEVAPVSVEGSARTSPPSSTVETSDGSREPTATLRDEPRSRARRQANDSDSGEEGVEVRVFWGETMLGSVFRVQPQAITLGETADADFQLPGQGLPAALFPIVETVAGESRIVFDSSMDGELEHPGQPPTRLRDLGSSAEAHSLAGCRAAALASGSFAWVQLETLRVEIAVRPAPRKVVAPFWAGLDYRFINTCLVLGFAMLAFIVSAALTPLDTDTTADDLFRNPTAMAKFIVKPPAKTKNPFLEKLKGETGKMKGEPAEKHKGKEGKMGKKNAPNKNARSAPKAIDVNAKEVVKNSGLMRLLGGGGAGLSTIFGHGGLGGDLKGAMGHMFGPAVGDAQGLGGLGLRGTGAGGGGLGNTIGIGDIGTKGRGGGLGGYGSGMGGLGHKGGSDVAISSGNPIVEGSLDKELIRRVIHQHRNQVRFCYESELVRHPGMNGKIMVKFVISGNGSVQRAAVDSSTLGNGNVESCIVSRVYQWEFPKPKGGGIVIVNYPFLLKESGD